MAKRHQASRRKAYGRRQHEVRERADRHHLRELIELDHVHATAIAAIDPFAFVDPRTPRLHLAVGE